MTHPGPYYVVVRSTRTQPPSFTGHAAGVGLGRYELLADAVVRRDSLIAQHVDAVITVELQP